MRLEFEQLRFSQGRAWFMDYYWFELPPGIEHGSDWVEYESERKFNSIIDKGFTSLTNSITGRKTVFIHKGLGLPLIGCQYFGIIDRGSSIVELRPNTGCNYNCIYCSVDEGTKGKHRTDYLVEPKYLIEETRKLLEFKKEKVELNINPQGEPLLYSALPELIKGLVQLRYVDRISIDTNGLLLNKSMNSLKKGGLSQVNLSLNSLDSANAAKISGCSNVIDKNTIIEAGKLFDMVIAPVYMPGINEQDIEQIIEFAKKNGFRLGIQNFLPYKHGRNVKGIRMDNFYEQLRTWEKKYMVKLIVTKEDFDIRKTKELPNPFRKGELVKPSIICDGRLANESIGVLKERAIHVRSNKQKIRISRIKHNIIVGN